MPIFFWLFSHKDENGDGVKVTLDENGKLTWVKYSKYDVSGGGVICAKRNIWEEIPHCYAQPPKEEIIGTTEDIPELAKDPVKFCRETCQVDVIQDFFQPWPSNHTIF